MALRRAVPLGLTSIFESKNIHEAVRYRFYAQVYVPA